MKTNYGDWTKSWGLQATALSIASAITDCSANQTAYHNGWFPEC